MDVTLTDVGPASSSNVSSAGDDNESWTILDEEDDLDLDETLSSTLASESRVEEVVLEQRQDDKPKQPVHPGFESDSDIETLDERIQEIRRWKNAVSDEDCYDSLVSDGIPVGEELSSDREQYIWSSEPDLDETLFLDQIQKTTIPDLTSQYPTEELPERFSEIKKGQTYIHNRNQHLNMILTALLVVFIAATLGLGIGNFLGWSSRIEIHEQFAEVQDEKLEELTDSLVSCMTGIEGQGGDDQDLDDKVIQHLSDENRRLKEELELIKDGKEFGVTEELTVILRDRINDLLVANADLEREVAKLRYANTPIESDYNLERTKSDLEQTKASLNEIAAENEQLKIAIGKARYGVPPPTIEEERERLTQLQIENEELKSEVRKYRETIPSVDTTPVDISEKVKEEAVAPVKFEEELFTAEAVAPVKLEEEPTPVGTPALEMPSFGDSKDTHATKETTVEVEDQLNEFVFDSSVVNEDLLEDEGYMSDYEDEDQDEYVGDLLDNAMTRFEDYFDMKDLELDEDFSTEEYAIIEKIFESDKDKSVPDVENVDEQNIDEQNIDEQNIDEQPPFDESVDESSEQLVDESTEEPISADEPEPPVKDDPFQNLFKSASNMFNQWKEKIGAKNKSTREKVRKAFDNLKEVGAKYMSKIVPTKTAEKMSELSDLLKEKGNEMRQFMETTFMGKNNTNFADKWFGKFSKNFAKTVTGLVDLLNDDISDDTKWKNRVDNLKVKMEKKWTGLKLHFKSFFNKSDGKNQNKKDTVNKKGDDGKTETKVEDKICEEDDNKPKSYRKWTKNTTLDKKDNLKENTTTNTQWIFARAEKREQSRKEQQKSDWVFDRANDRKKFHELTGADWSVRRVYNKQCQENEKGEIVCSNLDKLTTVNNGKESKRETRSTDKHPHKQNFDSSFLQQKKLRRSDVLPHEFNDMDDSDDDDSDEKDSSEDPKVSRRKFRQVWSFRDNFFAGNGAGRLPPKKPSKARVDPGWRDSKKMEKKARFQTHIGEKHQRKIKKPHMSGGFFDTL